MAPHKALFLLASPADVLSARFVTRSRPTNDVSGAGTRDEPLRTSAWEANFMAPRILTIFAVTIYTHDEMRSHTVFY